MTSPSIDSSLEQNHQWKKCHSCGLWKWGNEECPLWGQTWAQGQALALRNCVSLDQLPSQVLNFFICTMFPIPASQGCGEDSRGDERKALGTACQWTVAAVLLVHYHKWKLSWEVIITEFFPMWEAYEKGAYITWYVNKTLSNIKYLMHKLVTVETLWLPPIWLVPLPWCSLNDLSSRLKFISSTLPPWRKSIPASTLVYFSQHKSLVWATHVLQFNLTYQWPGEVPLIFFSCWNAFPVPHISVSNPILWNTCWKNGFSTFTLFPVGRSYS